MPSRALRPVLAAVLSFALAAAACSADPGEPGGSPSGSAPTTTGEPNTSGGPTSGAPTTSNGPTSSGGPTSSAPATSAGTTAPADAFGFAVLGDFGSGTGDEHAVADEMRSWADDHRLDAVVTTGDNVYENGLPEEFDAAWQAPYGWVDDRGIPVVAALGNHDVDDAGNTQELGLFDMPGKWYERTIGPVRFIVLDANDPTDPEQLDWLRSTLAEDSDAPWTVVTFHQPAYSCSFHQSTPAVDEAWVPLFGPGGVDLVLNGHDHAYERFPVTDGVTYVVQGAGGADLYPVSPILCPTGTPDPVFADDDHHLFLYLTVTGDRLSGEAVTADGKVVDTFVLPGR